MRGYNLPIMKLVILLILSWEISHAGMLSSYVFGTTGYGSVAAGCSQTGTTNASCSQAHNGAAVNLSASSDYGNLNSSLAGGGGIGLNMYSQTSFNDTLTVYAAGVSSGYVQYSFLVVANGYSSSDPLNIGVQQNGNNILLASPLGAGTLFYPSVDQTYTTSLASFSSGVPFSFSASAFLGTFFEASSSVVAEASDQLQYKLTQISVFDASGNGTTSGITVYSPSSTYGGLVTETPEPSTVLVLLSTATFLGWRQHRLMRRGKPFSMRHMADSVGRYRARKGR